MEKFFTLVGAITVGIALVAGLLTLGWRLYHNAITTDEVEKIAKRIEREKQDKQGDDK